MKIFDLGSKLDEWEKLAQIPYYSTADCDFLRDQLRAACAELRQFQKVYEHDAELSGMRQKVEQADSRLAIAVKAMKKAEAIRLVGPYFHDQIAALVRECCEALAEIDKGNV